MDGYLRNALGYSVLPVMATLAGAILVAFKPLSASVATSARRFASGAAFAVIAIELLPDVLHAHRTAGIAGFGLGVAAMIAMKWPTPKRERASEENNHCLPRRLIGAGAGVPIAGLLIGAGFAAGVREGQLLTLVATAETLAVAVAVVTSLYKPGALRGKLLLIAMAPAAIIIAGAVAGTMFMWGRAGVDLDIVFAFCLAAMLVRALESLVESYEDQPPLRGAAFFFAGFILFLLLGRSLGGSHTAHPGERASDQRPSQLRSLEAPAWYNHAHIHPLQIIKRKSGLPSG